MEKLEGKYFESTINKLKEAKDAERFEMRSEFREDLRASLVEKAGVLPVETDWSDAILRWRYLLGAVPTLAVLTIVAANVANLQVKIPAAELIPQNVGQNVSSSTTVNTVIQNDTVNQVEGGQSYGIVTFSSALVMPSADVLAKARAGGAADLSSPNFSVVYIQPVQNSDQSQPLNFLNDFNNEIKLNPPKVDLFTFDINNNTQPVNYNFSTQPVLVGPSVVLIPVNNIVSPVEDSVRPENNGRLEIFQKVETVPLNQNNEVTLPRIENNNVQTEVVVPTTLVQEVTPINTVINKEIPQAPVLVDTAKKIYVLESQDDVYVDSANEAMVKGGDVDLSLNNLSEAMPTFVEPVLLESSRIVYDGRDKSLVTALVLKELRDRNGNLSSDYFVRVGKLEDGKLKISLFEFGKLKSIIFMEMDERGEYKAVTEVNY